MTKHEETGRAKFLATGTTRRMICICSRHQLPPVTSCHQVRVKASNEVGWSVLEPVQISCRTAERPHRPRHLSCVDLGTQMHEEPAIDCRTLDETL